MQKTLACGRLCRAETFAVRKAPPQGNVRSEGNSAVRELRFARARGPAARNLPRAGVSAVQEVPPHGKLRRADISAVREAPPYGKPSSAQNPSRSEGSAMRGAPP